MMCIKALFAHTTSYCCFHCRDDSCCSFYFVFVFICVLVLVFVLVDQKKNAHRRCAVDGYELVFIYSEKFTRQPKTGLV